MPEKIQLIQMAKQSAHLEGQIPLTVLKRLSAYLYQGNFDRVLSVIIDFGVDYDGLSYMKGRVWGFLPLVCQRCLNAVDFEVNVEFNLSPVLSEAEAKKLPERYDPVLIIDNQCDLSFVIEDELILGIPIVALHEHNNCNNVV